MKTKFLTILLATGVAALGTPAIASSAEADTSQLSFSCQMIDGVATTVANSAAGDAQIPIFHWKAEVLANRTSDSPKELCNDVAQKLEAISVDYDFSNINFIGTTIIPDGDIPTICANTGGPQCSKVLFSLNKTDDKASVVAGNVVDAILDKNLQPQKTVLTTRGVQSISYQVDFWSLLGLKFSNKY